MTISEATAIFNREVQEATAEWQRRVIAANLKLQAAVTGAGQDEGLGSSPVDPAKVPMTGADFSSYDGLMDTLHGADPGNPFTPVEDG